MGLNHPALRQFCQAYDCSEIMPPHCLSSAGALGSKVRRQRIAPLLAIFGGTYFPADVHLKGVTGESPVTISDFVHPTACRCREERALIAEDLDEFFLQT